MKRHLTKFAAGWITLLSSQAMALPIEMPRKPAPRVPSECGQYASYYEGNYNNTWEYLASEWQWLSDRDELWEDAMCDNHFQYCHCSRCQKVTGSAHAFNLFCPPSQFRWTRGEEQVGR